MAFFSGLRSRLPADRIEEVLTGLAEPRLLAHQQGGRPGGLAFETSLSRPVRPAQAWRAGATDHPPAGHSASASTGQAQGVIASAFEQAARAADRQSAMLSRIAADGIGSGALPARTPGAPTARRDRARVGALSSQYEVGNRGPGTVSSGRNDRGGSSYGSYQFASNHGQPQQFLATDGRRWRGEFRGARPGTAEFNRVWQAIASREPDAFQSAQHAYIGRTHYEPALQSVQRSTGVDLDARTDAVRDAVWSTSVQHAEAPTLLRNSVRAADRIVRDRNSPAYDEVLINQIYDARVAYLTGLSQDQRRPAGQRQQLRDIAGRRMVQERRDALDRLRQSRAAGQ